MWLNAGLRSRFSSPEIKTSWKSKSDIDIEHGRENVRQKRNKGSKVPYMTRRAREWKPKWGTTKNSNFRIFGFVA